MEMAYVEHAGSGQEYLSGKEGRVGYEAPMSFLRAHFLFSAWRGPIQSSPVRSSEDWIKEAKLA